MQGLIGKITSLKEINVSDNNVTFTVKFSPVSTLPNRKPVPDWLKGQTLEVERTVQDRREIGGVGDSIVLNALESAKWLHPLVVSTELAVGVVPNNLELNLRWWKEDKAPSYRVKANNVILNGEFEPSGNGQFNATVSTDGFSKILPLTISVECESINVTSNILPDGKLGGWPVESSYKKTYEIDSVWYRASVITNSHMGGIVSLKEKARDINHFQAPEGITQPVLENGGHYDRYRTSAWDWNGKSYDAGLTSKSVRCLQDTVRFSSETVVDEGENLYSSCSCIFYNDFPLMAYERNFQRRSPKDKKSDNGIPEEAIDSIVSIGMGCRSATLIERNGGINSSRAVFTHDGKLLKVRSSMPYEYMQLGGSKGILTIEDGWTLIEHPNRKSYLLYLFDRSLPPIFGLWNGLHEMSFEPMWLNTLLKQDSSCGLSFGLAAGETAGVSERGAWVACRRPTASGAIETGIVARLRDNKDNKVTVTSGSCVKEAELASVIVPGIGWISYTTVLLDNGDKPFTVNLAGMEGRS